MQSDHHMARMQAGGGAELLWDASRRMRAQHGPDHERHEMWAAMARWLEGLGDEIDGDNVGRRWSERERNAALAVARAYLGGTP